MKITLPLRISKKNFKRKWLKKLMSLIKTTIIQRTFKQITAVILLPKVIRLHNLRRKYKLQTNYTLSPGKSFKFPMIFQTEKIAAHYWTIHYPLKTNRIRFQLRKRKVSLYLFEVQIPLATRFQSNRLLKR